VIHAHFWMSGLTSLRGADLLDIPLAVTFHALGSVKRRHQPQADTSADTRIPAERRLIRYADRVIATCSDEVDELLALGGDSRTIETIPCGVEPDRFRTGWRSNVTLPRRTAQHRLVCLSRLVPRKGVAEAIEMLAHLPDADLLVAGGPSVNTLDDDPEVQRLRGIADDLGVEHRVLFVGAVAREDVPAVMAQADVGVCLPWYEPFGIVPLEMMACQKPVVGTKVGGLLDTVVDGSTGLLVPPKSPHHAATAVRALLDDPVMRSEMGRKARERVEQSYDWRRVAEATESVYEQMVLEKLQGIRGLPVAGTAS
jgi:glycosyltransferase involved in cell wall biosynthesis